AITCDFTAFHFVNRFSRRSRSVKRTGNGRPQSGRTGSEDRRSTTPRKPPIKRRRSRASSRKLNSISGGWDGSPGARETGPREKGFHSTGPKLAIWPPVAFHEDLLWTLMQRSVGGQPARPEDRRKQDTWRVRRRAGCRAAGRRWAPTKSTG